MYLIIPRTQMYTEVITYAFHMATTSKQQHL